MDERDPVDDGEFLYRRIHRTFLDPSAPISIQFPAFRPNPNDTTGLSLFRAAFGQPADTLAPIDPSKVKDYLVARLSARDLRNLALSVIPDPVSGGPLGHAVIPELNWTAYQANKQLWKPIIVELAKLGSDSIVLWPT